MITSEHVYELVEKIVKLPIEFDEKVNEPLSLTLDDELFLLIARKKVDFFCSHEVKIEDVVKSSNQALDDLIPFIDKFMEHHSPNVVLMIQVLNTSDRLKELIRYNMYTQFKDLDNIDKETAYKKMTQFGANTQALIKILVLERLGRHLLNYI